jgi:hypothetical protein
MYQPPNPKIVDCWVSGFGGPGTRNLGKFGEINKIWCTIELIDKHIDLPMFEIYFCLHIPSSEFRTPQPRNPRPGSPQFRGSGVGKMCMNIWKVEWNIFERCLISNVKSRVSNFGFQDSRFRDSALPKSGSWNSGFDIWYETSFKNVSFNLSYIHTHFTNPRTPELWTARSRVSGFGGPELGTRNSVCVNKNIFQTWVSQCVCQSIQL